jgi:hypothetical protein
VSVPRASGLARRDVIAFFQVTVMSPYYFVEISDRSIEGPRADALTACRCGSVSARIKGSGGESPLPRASTRHSVARNLCWPVTVKIIAAVLGDASK